MWRLLILLLAQPAAAEIRVQEPDAFLAAAGAFCPGAGTLPQEAPLTAMGRVLTDGTPFQITLPGDRFAAEPDLGIGIVVQLAPLWFAAPIHAEVWRQDRPLEGEVLDLQPRKDGALAIGLFPDPGQALQPGRYKLGVYTERHSILVFAITVTEGEASAGLSCAVALS